MLEHKNDLTGVELFKEFQDSILSSHEPEVLITEERVFDFLPDIRKGSLVDEGILRNWTIFLINKKVPFLIVEKEGKKMLWKRRVV